MAIPKSLSGRLGVIYDQADGAQSFALGTCDHGEDGTSFVYAQANGAISQFDVCLLPESWAADQLDTTNSAASFGEKVGVAYASLADSQYGWFLVCGTADAINVGSSCAANTALNATATPGRLDDDATVGAEVVDRLVLTTAESSGNQAPGVLSHPTIGATL